MRCPRSNVLRRRAVPIASLCLIAGQAAGQTGGLCGFPAIYEFGGRPTAVCSAGSSLTPQTSLQAVARGRWVSIESNPLISGTPTVVGRVALDAPAVFMHTEISGRIWATDERTIYGIVVNGGPPTLVGKLTLPTTSWVERLRVKGNFVYAIDSSKLYVIDVSVPSAPVLRSTTTIAGAWLEDLEVVGSYAYLAIDEHGTVDTYSMVVVDVSNPLAPVEVRRVGNSNRRGERLSKAPNLSGLYALAENNAAGALELWSLSNASNPTLLAVNATLTRESVYQGELKAANTAILVLDSYDDRLLTYNTSTLAQVGTPLVFPSSDNVEPFGIDPPYAFIPRQSGEVARVQYTLSPPAVINPFIDVVPGGTYDIVASGEGFTVLSSFQTDLWFFATPTGGAPYSFAHLKPDAGFRFGGQRMALLSGGTLFVPQFGGTPTSPVTRILAYRVTGHPAPSVQLQGFFDVPALITDLTAGVDANGVRRVYYTLTGTGGANPTLNILNAANLASMSFTSSFALTSGVSSPLMFMPAAGSAPPRVLVSGYASGKTQIVSVLSAGSPSSLGVIPSTARALHAGPNGIVWSLDENILRAHDISVPAAPVMLSERLISISPYNYPGTALGRYNTSGTQLGVVTGGGDLVRIDATNPAAPSVLQVIDISSPQYFGGGPFVLEAGNIHVANGLDGYSVFGQTMSALPREDPSRTTRNLEGRQGIKGICGSAPFTLTARFVANPAVTAHRWYRYNRTTFTYSPLTDGPTGTGSIISGAQTATLTISNPSAPDATFYYCEATNICGSARGESIEARVGGYANCDASTVFPILNALDFSCFLTRYRNDGPGGFTFDYSNCDGSTLYPVLNALDFSCFLQRYQAACQ